jgi:uncharacterized protein YcfJ
MGSWRPIAYLLQEKSMNSILKSALAIAGLTVATQAAAQITFFQNEYFEGPAFTSKKEVSDFQRKGFNDRASSVVVLGGRWEVCQDAGFSGRCVVLKPGRYASLANMNLNDRLSSARPVSQNARIDDSRFAPAPASTYEYRRQPKERVYQADVTSSHAVMGPPEQRCWVEHEQVSQGRGEANIPGAIVGGIIGGVLGHQVGGGRGQDLATAGGVVAGAAIGSNVGRDGSGQTYTQDVKRCETVPSNAPPRYWDVTYNFRGQEHRVQMAAAPGTRITVNEQGEPRE